MKSVTVIFIPESPQNPYQQALCESLQQLGIEVQYSKNFPSLSETINNRTRPTIFHLHWLSNLYRSRITWFHIFVFIARLLTAKFLGHKIVWTAHNILPHRRCDPFIDLTARFVVVQLVDAIIAHCDNAKFQIERRFLRKRNICVIPHGNYIHFYENHLSQALARETLKIQKNNFVYLSFGNLLPYKGIDSLIQAFNLIHDSNSLLMIAGRCSRDDKSRIEKFCQSNPRIKIDFGFVPSDKVQLYLNAADVLVAPFSDVLTSGSVILALSFGLPIIAPTKGCLPELIDGNAGILYSDNDPEGLYRAMKAIRSCDIKNMGQTARRIAERLDWHLIAELTSEVYDSVYIKSRHRRPVA